MITAEQVADLREGDEIEIREAHWPVGSVIRGRLYKDYHQALHVAGRLVAYMDGSGPTDERTASSLTVVSRAPRPLYVNHPRPEPVDHDVARDGEGAIRHCDAKGFGGKPTWWSFEAIAGCKWTHTTFPPQPLTLLVDGETGQVVP